VDGKRHLNFNEFNKYRIAKQYKKLEECIEEVKDGEMPLESYTIIHKNAILTEAEKTTLTNWCMTVRDSIKAKYPADSLVLPKRK
ncbi:MAG: heme-binding domain-containing protein, partial [Sediminibacterium sp.]